MIKKAILTLAITISSIAITFAGDINGKWAGKVMDQFDVVYTFAADGEKLTGSTVGPDGNTITITDGVIKGDDLTFTIEIMGNALKVTGKMDGEKLKLSMNMMGNDVAIDLVKAK
ncbi:MAG: hypothetical protein V4683_03880 [Bacteroidota bacterium]